MPSQNYLKGLPDETQMNLANALGNYWRTPQGDGSSSTFGINPDPGIDT